VNSRRHVVALLPVLVACGPSGDAPAPAPAPIVAPETPKPSEPPKSAADPMKDVAAWKALPAAERAAKAGEFVAKLDAGDARAVESARAFLAERGEDAAIASLAKAALAKGGNAAWQHESVGDVNVGPEADACLKAGELAEEAADPKFLELKALRAAHPGTWWADAASAAKTRALCAEVKAQETFLATPYGQGVAHWARWQRAIPVMQDAPAVSGWRGPYMIFVSLDSEAATAGAPANPDETSKAAAKRKPRELIDVPPDEVEKAKKILKKNLDLMERFYEGWISELGPVFGFTRYGPENTDVSTLLKMNVFMNAEEYRRYNKSGGNDFMNEFARAYYTPSEPRFITTYDGGQDENPYQTAQVQCHEATHQLVHFYTWDLTRKALKRDVKWDDCRVRPMWAEEGFAEFFSSFTVKDGKYSWMQPLGHRLLEIYVLDDVVAAKKWAPFALKDFFTVSHAGELVQLGELRAGLNVKEREAASNVMSNLFYAEAWSLYYFMWNAEDGGKPKYRDRFVEYLKLCFHLRYEYDKFDRKEKVLSVSTKDFRRIMGLADEAALTAFDKEWRAWEAKLIEEHKKPYWDQAKKRARAAFGVEK
jgi:hypothetical protein